LQVPLENLSANVVCLKELRISQFDPTVSSLIDVGGGTLLRITFHRCTGGESPIAFAENSEIGSIDADLTGTQFQSGRVVGSLED